MNRNRAVSQSFTIAGYALMVLALVAIVAFQKSEFVIGLGGATLGLGAISLTFGSFYGLAHEE